jgi:threonine dehydrogenase-like Zn-dependent dehydrogenase
MSNIPASVDFTALLRKEAPLFTVYRYANCYQPVLRLFESGKIHVKEMVSHQYPLSEIGTAFNMALDPSVNTMKIIIE